MSVLPVPVERMEGLIRQRKDLVIKIGDKYEISRPLVLELWKLLTEEVIRLGGSIRESAKVEYASDDMVIMSVSVSIKIGESEVVFCEVGEAYRDEKGKENVMARIAFTRAIKRVFERIAGQDFINRIILSLFPNGVEEAPATDRQKELIAKLLEEKRITDKVIERLKEAQKLPQDFDLNRAMQENALSFSQARTILDAVVGRRQ